MHCCWLEDGRSHLTKNRSDLLEALRVPQLTTSRNTGTSGPRSQGTGFFQQQQWDWKLILSWGVSVRTQPGWYLDFCLLMPWAENSVESACISEVQTFELINECDFKLLSLDHLYHSSRELMYHYNHEDSLSDTSDASKPRGLQSFYIHLFSDQWENWSLVLYDSLIWQILKERS